MKRDVTKKNRSGDFRTDTSGVIHRKTTVLNIQAHAEQILVYILVPGIRHLVSYEIYKKMTQLLHSYTRTYPAARIRNKSCAEGIHGSSYTHGLYPAVCIWLHSLQYSMPIVEHHWLLLKQAGTMWNPSTARLLSPRWTVRLLNQSQCVIVWSYVMILVRSKWFVLQVWSYDQAKEHLLQSDYV